MESILAMKSLRTELEQVKTLCGSLRLIRKQNPLQFAVLFPLSPNVYDLQITVKITIDGTYSGQGEGFRLEIAATEPSIIPEGLLLLLERLAKESSLGTNVYCSLECFQQRLEPVLMAAGSSMFEAYQSVTVEGATQRRYVVREADLPQSAPDKGEKSESTAESISGVETETCEPDWCESHPFQPQEQSFVEFALVGAVAQDVAKARVAFTSQDSCSQQTGALMAAFSRSTELKQVERRYRETFEVLANTSKYVAFSLTLKPTDPGFSFATFETIAECGGLNLRATSLGFCCYCALFDITGELAVIAEFFAKSAFIRIPWEWHESGQTCNVSVENMRSSTLGVKECLRIEAATAERRVLRWLDKSLGDFLHCTAAQEGVGDSEEAGGEAAPMAGLQAEPLQLVGCEFAHVSSCRLTKPKFAFACRRCKTSSEVTAPSSQPMAWTCKRSVAGSFSNLLNVVPLDFLPSTFHVVCNSCGSGTNVSNVQIGRAYHRPCRKCFARIRIFFGAVSFPDLRAFISFSDKWGDDAASIARRDKDRVALVVGQKLANEGRCKHYGKSFRWLRFPCCGRAFPCDICHEDANSDGHEMEFANRMICGFCSQEQAFVTAGTCSRCRASLTGRGGRRFWEGGSGTRNPELLRRGDKRKYRLTQKK